jgi:hypothetical protein
MAITIIEQPQSYTPVYNDMVVLTSSNLTANPKFLFGLDVYVTLEGFGDSFLGRLKTPSVINLFAPTLDERGFFNIKEFLKSTGYFATKNNYWLADISHRIKLIPGEEYAASASGVATYYPSSANIQYVGFNGALRLDEFRQFVPTDLINTTTIAASSGIGQYIMSSYTQPKNILRSTLNELTFLCNGGTNTRAIVSYYINNALITTQTVAVTTANRTDITINASYNALAVPPNANKIGVRLERISNGEWLTNQYEYNLVEACSKYPTLNVYFQNKWGAYDSFIFNKKSTKRDSINRKTYQKQDRYINTYNSYDPAIRTYDSEIKTRHTLSTDWVTEEEMTWLSELVESNNVQFSYDSEFILGRKAEVTITVTENPATDWWFDPYSQTMTATMGAVNLVANFPVSTTPYEFADEFYFTEIKPVLLASNWNTYFDIDESGVTSSAIVFKMVAKTKGAASTLTSVSTGSGGSVGSQMFHSNNITGITEVLPTTIPIQIEDTSFEFKTRDNDKLFQLTINAVETSVYNRQNL